MKKTKRQRDVPAIRFPGFTDSWEQRKLGELCNITTGKLDANAMVSDGQYDFYTSGIDVFKIGVAAFEGPAITIAGNGASVGYMHLADGKFNAYQRTYVLTDFLADRQFLNVAIGNELPDKIQEEVRGSGIPYIVLNMLTDLAIPFPSHEEQYAIGVYFQQLDNLITLQERKCRVLRELKKCMLQKMFPKNGSDIPEIRFPGFTDSWEQRKLLDYADFYSGNGLSWNDISDDGQEECILYGNLYTEYGMIADKIVYRTNSTIKNPVYSKFGDVLIPASDTTPTGLARATSIEKSGVLLGGDINIVRPKDKINGSCLSLAINANKKELIKFIKGTSVRHIHNADIKTIEIPMPQNNAEQEKLVNYFKNLDNLIILQERKCKVLRELKKCMLQKMFV